MIGALFFVLVTCHKTGWPSAAYEFNRRDACEHIRWMRQQEVSCEGYQRSGRLHCEKDAKKLEWTKSYRGTTPQ